MTSMNPPEEDENVLAFPTYWDDRYNAADGERPTHEWFKSYQELQPFFTKHLLEPCGVDSAPRILHLGNGDSTIPRHLHDLGYKHQICMDFSSVVVDLMRSQQLNGIQWICGDVRDMSTISNSSIDVAFDKGTLDAMIYGSPWDPPDEVVDNAGRYMREVARVLRDQGTFLYVTFRQPHFMRPLLNRDGLWSLSVEVLTQDGSTFDYHAYVMKKASGP